MEFSAKRDEDDRHVLPNVYCEDLKSNKENEEVINYRGRLKGFCQVVRML